MLRERQQYSGVGDATIVQLSEMQPDALDENLSMTRYNATMRYGHEHT